MSELNIEDIPLNQLSDDQFKNFFDDFMSEKGVKEKSVVQGRVIGISDDTFAVAELGDMSSILQSIPLVSH